MTTIISWPIDVNSSMKKRFAGFPERRRHYAHFFPLDEVIKPLSVIHFHKKTSIMDSHQQDSGFLAQIDNKFVKQQLLPLKLNALFTYILALVHVVISEITAASQQLIQTNTTQTKTRIKCNTRSVTTVKKKSPNTVLSKYPNLKPFHVLYAYADLIHLLRSTVSVLVARVYQQSRNILWQSKITDHDIHVFSKCDDCTLIPQDISIRNDSVNIESGKNNPNVVLSTDLCKVSKRQPERKYNLSNKQANQNSNSSERSSMDEIIAQELAALAGEVDNSDVPFAGSNFFENFNADMLREDSIRLPNLDDLEDSDFDFDPLDAEGGDYGNYEPSSPYDRLSLPRRSPIPDSWEDEQRFFDEAYANHIASTDNQLMLTYDNFDEASSSESEDEVDSPNSPKRLRLSEPDQHPKSPSS